MLLIAVGTWIFFLNPGKFGIMHELWNSILVATLLNIEQNVIKTVLLCYAAGQTDSGEGIPVIFLGL